MYNDLKFTLEVVDELGQLKLADALAKAFDFLTQALGRSGQSGGSQGHGHRGGGRVGPRCATGPEPIYEEGDESGVEESWLEGDWVLSDDGVGTPQCTTHDAIGPSHIAGDDNTIPAHTSPVVLARSTRPLDSPPVCRP